uniref:excisionase family DNA-binding protein n=1 Tax=Mariniflexile sp. TaxID=1979402 RepID=UPI0040476BF0
MQDKYVSIEELADYFSVSVSTIRAWIRNGQLTSKDFLKVGNTYRFRILEIENALRGKASKNAIESTPTAKSTLTEDAGILLNAASQAHPAPASHSASSWTENAEFINELRSALHIYEDLLGSVTPRESDIYRMRTDQRMTYVEIGRRINLTRQSVARIFHKTQRKFRHPMRADRAREELTRMFRVAAALGVTTPQLERFLVNRHFGLALLCVMLGLNFDECRPGEYLNSHFPK